MRTFNMNTLLIIWHCGIFTIVVIAYEPIYDILKEPQFRHSGVWCFNCTDIILTTQTKQANLNELRVQYKSALAGVLSQSKSQ